MPRSTFFVKLIAARLPPVMLSIPREKKLCEITAEVALSPSIPENTFSRLERKSSS